MPAFHFGGIAKQGSSQDYSSVIDALSIKENQLASDGKLSPGDYKILKIQAMQAYAHPGLTPSQRGQIAVKMSGYDKDSSSLQVKKSQDITRMNNDVKNDNAANTMLAGNNPLSFLINKERSLGGKINQLSTAIDQMQSQGADEDASAHVNELLSTKDEYQDTLQAISDVKNYLKNPTGKPASDLAAYIKTNSKGEIVDVKVDREGAQSGYYETNGLYGGLKVYGKENSKEGNNVIFKLGKDKYVQEAPGAFTQSGTFQNLPKLLSTRTTKGQNFGIKSEGDSYVDAVTPDLKTQQAIPDGGWARGANSGMFYNRKGESYTKYTSSDQAKQAGASDTNTVDIPKLFEDNLIPNVETTADAGSSFTPPAPVAGVGQNVGSPIAPRDSQPSPIAPVDSGSNPGRSRTPAPIPAAPSTFGGVANNALNSAKSFLGSLFGK